VGSGKGKARRERIRAVGESKEGSQRTTGKIERKALSDREARKKSIVQLRKEETPMLKAVAYQDTYNGSHQENVTFLADLLEEIEQAVQEEQKSRVLRQSVAPVISLPRPTPQPHRLYSYD
jgi:hypothetical protein